MTLRTDPELVRAVEVPWLIGDFTKLHDATGWEPKYSLEETLSELLANARERYRTTAV
jgi:GDP-4-dehydro-6-deoxy-D-mannose reductase